MYRFMCAVLVMMVLVGCGQGAVTPSSSSGETGVSTEDLGAILDQPTDAPSGLKIMASGMPSANFGNLPRPVQSASRALVRDGSSVPMPGGFVFVHLYTSADEAKAAFTKITPQRGFSGLGDSGSLVTDRDHTSYDVAFVRCAAVVSLMMTNALTSIPNDDYVTDYAKRIDARIQESAICQ